MKPAWLLLGAALILPTPALSLGFEDARHLLARTSFAPAPTDFAPLAPKSWEQAVGDLVDKAGRRPVTPEPAFMRDSLAYTAPRLRTEEEKLAWAKQNREWRVALKGWWYREMIDTPTPLTETMTLFWHNHFTSSLQKVKLPGLLYRQNLMLREHALGNFGDMLRAVVRDPAMMVYLDNATNFKTAPNENFARELLELFTLGEGHYGEADIKEAARALTGYSVDGQTGRFLFRRAQHDSGAKTFLGRTGNFDGEDIVSILLEEPETARRIARKLWRTFVNDDPDPAEIERLASLFRNSGYEIKPLMKALLTAPAFRDPANRGVLVKSPVEYVVGTFRLFQTKPGDMQPLVAYGHRLGQDLFDPPTVEGWQGGEDWINADTLLARQLLPQRIARGSEDPKMTRRAGVEASMSPERASEILEDRDRLQAYLLAIPPTRPFSSENLNRAVVDLLSDPAFQLK